MNIVDLMLLIWILGAIVRGYRIGFLRQAFSFIGFCVGLLIGSWVSPFLAALMDSGGSRLIITLLSTLGIAMSFATGGEWLAAHFQSKVDFKLAHKVNAGLGMIFNAIGVLVITWLLTSALIRLPLANLGFAISESKILWAVDRTMPPAPAIMGQFGRFISPHGFPEIFISDEPIVDPAGPAASAEVEAAAAKAVDSTVKIEGNACGGVSVGSGFAAAPGFVITNAHVIAGVRSPVIIHGSERYRSVPVLFDPALDLAVLKASDLNAPHLPLSDVRIDRGRSAAVLGYPGGRRLTIDPAVFLGRREALGRDIYNRALATREIYEVQAAIEQGNSGGPLVLPDGTVAGVMFGASLTRENLSYALASVEIIDDLETAIRNNTAVSTGPCV